MPPGKIKEIGDSHIGILRQLALNIWPGAFEKILSPQQIDYMLEMMYSTRALQNDMHRGVRYFILQIENRSCGYAAIEKTGGMTVKLHKIYLAQHLRGKGQGKLLLQKMEEIAKRENATFITLNVNRHNRAVDFYKNCGYHIVKAEDIDIGNGFFMNDYVMGKSLR